MKIILKSSSPRRKEILEKYKYDFEVHPFEVDETFDVAKTPYENVKELGLKKARAHKDEFINDIQIGCDTIVVLDNIVYGKPKDLSDAKRMLELLNGKMHYVLSGVGIIYKDLVYNFVSVSRVYFKNNTIDEINKYLETKESLGKAGAYAIQGYGKNLISHYEGSLYNIIGLPIEDISKIIGEIYEFSNKRYKN